MATQQQKNMVTKSIEYWVYFHGRSGLTLPYLSAMSELTPPEVLEVLKEARPADDEGVASTYAYFCLSYCREIGAPLIVITCPDLVGSYQRVGDLLVSPFLIETLSLHYEAVSVIATVLSMANEVVAEGNETKVYDGDAEVFKWGTLSTQQKQNWRRDVQNWIMNPEREEEEEEVEELVEDHDPQLA